MFIAVYLLWEIRCTNFSLYFNHTHYRNQDENEDAKNEFVDQNHSIYLVGIKHSSLIFLIISFIIFFLTPTLCDNKVSYIVGLDVDTIFKVNKTPFIIYIDYTTVASKRFWDQLHYWMECEGWW